MEKIYNKLVRDKIPEIIRSNNQTPYTKVLNEKEFKTALEEKLYEEYKEVLTSSGEERAFELADMLEVIKALAKVEGKTIEDILLIADQKNLKRGAFNERIFLEKVDE